MRRVNCCRISSSLQDSLYLARVLFSKELLFSTKHVTNAYTVHWHKRVKAVYTSLFSLCEEHTVELHRIHVVSLWKCFLCIYQRCASLRASAWYSFSNGRLSAVQRLCQAGKKGLRRLYKSFSPSSECLEDRRLRHESWAHQNVVYALYAYRRVFKHASVYTPTCCRVVCTAYSTDECFAYICL